MFLLEMGTPFTDLAGAGSVVRIERERHPVPKPTIGGVQNHQLGYYLDEFAFRFNRRNSKARGLLFYRLGQQAVAVSSAPYRTIIGTERQARGLGQ